MPPKIPRQLTILIVVFLVVILVVTLFPRSVAPPPQMYWPTYQADVERTGYVDYRPPSDNSSRWVREITLHSQAGKDVSSCIAYEKVFIGVGNSIRAYRFSDGALLWGRPGFAVHNSFTVGSEMIFVSREDSLLALRQSDASTAWSWSIAPDTDTTGVNPSLYYSGRVIASHDVWTKFPEFRIQSMLLFSLDAQTGTPIWTKTLSGSKSLSYLAASDGRLFVANDTSMLCFSADGGRLLWSHYISKEITTRSPVVVGSRVLLGTAEQLLSLDASDGTLLWSLPGNFRYTSVSVKDNMAFGILPSRGQFVDDWGDAEMIAVDIQSGGLVWKRAFVTSNSYDAASPLIIMRNTIVAAIGNEVRAYSAEDGELLWIRDLGETRIAWSLLSAADRSVVVLSEGYSGTSYWVRVTVIG